MLNNKVIKFFLVGVFSNFINWFMYVATFIVFKDINISAVLGYLSGMLISVLCANLFVFENPHFSILSLKVLYQVIIHLFGMVMLSVLINFFHITLSLGVSTSWLFAALPIAVFNYLSLKLVTEGAR